MVITTGLNSPIIRARLAIFAGDLSTAEDYYVKKANRPELAINMYKQFNRWTDAIALAERSNRPAVAGLKQQHMDYLTSTGKTHKYSTFMISAGLARIS